MDASVTITDKEPVQSLCISDRLSKREQLCIRSFPAHGHPFHLYSYGPIADVPTGTTIMDANAILPRKCIFRIRYGHHKEGRLGSFVDWFRWELLYRRGGWWVDMNMLCLRPFYFEQESICMVDSLAVMRFPVGQRLIGLLTRHCARPTRWMPWDSYEQRLKKIYHRLQGRYHPNTIHFGQSGGIRSFRRALAYCGYMARAVPTETFDPLLLMSSRQALEYIDNRTLPEGFPIHSHTIRIEDITWPSNVSIPTASTDQPSIKRDVSGQVMQSLWVGGQLSKLEQLCIRSFLAHGHPFHLYSYEPMADVPAGTTIMDANAILPQARVFRHRHGSTHGGYTGFADWFRWELLYRRGGWWVDMDLVCLRPLDFEQATLFVRALNRYWTWNGLLKFPAGHVLPRWLAQNYTRPTKWLPYDDLYTRCKKIYRTLQGQYRSDTIRWGEIGGPRAFYQALVHFGLQAGALPTELFLPVKSSHRQLLRLFQSHQDDLIRNMQREYYTVHFYNDVLRRLEQAGRFAGKDADYPADSPFEILKRHYGVE